MKKYFLRLLALLACLMLLTACGAEAGGNDPEEKETEGYSEEVVYCMTGLTYQGIQFAVTYEENGVHLDPILTEPDSSAYACVYSWDGRLLLERLVDEKGNELSRTELSYAENGNVVDRVYTSHTSGSTTRWVYEYNDRGQIVNRHYYSAPETVSSAYSYSYDDRGFPTECFVTGAEDEPRWRYVYSCNEEGKIVSGQRYVLSEKLGQVGLQSDLVYTYDDAGRLLGIAWEPIVENTYVRVSKYYTYDGEGRLTGYQAIHQEKDLVEDKTFTYDAEGHLIGVTDPESANREFTYGEMTVNSKLAEGAQQWSTTGAINAYTPEEDPFLMN